MTVIGILHPGEMGAAFGSVLRDAGHPVLWVSNGRSDATQARATAAGLEDAGSLAALTERCDVIMSICPPHAALELAEALPPFDGVFVDANAIAPETARRVGAAVEARGASFVDGGIVGSPPIHAEPRLFLAGGDAALVAGLFAETAVQPRVLAGLPGDASAVKCAFAAWTKGSGALLLAVRAFARAEGVEAALLEEWSASLPELELRSETAQRSAKTKGWRWVGEMEEIAAAFAADGLPRGFHEAAADVYRPTQLGRRRAE
jgi:3-hydroxyisobutyrate dehydrogenase-like beta-hydroxyacid dehydrogenase